MTGLLSRGPLLTLQEAREFAAERVLATGKLNGLSPSRVFPMWERFEKFAAAFGGVTRVREVTPEIAAAFVMARTTKGRPTGSTQSLRRCALRIWFRVLREYGLMDNEPTLDLEVAPRAHRDVRPLTANEVEDGRWAAAAGQAASRATAIWAMAESGMWPAEIAMACMEDFDVLSASMHVRAVGKALERVVPVDGWCLDRLRQRTDEVGPGRLVFDGDASPAARLSITAVLRRTLERAGFGRDPLITLDSVPATAGRRAYDATGRVEDAARLLGLTRLDRTARLIALDWLDGP